MTWVEGGRTAGRRNVRAKVTEEIVIAIRLARQDTKRRSWPRDHPQSTYSLAAKYGLTPSQVSKIALGRQWGHVAGGRA